MMRRGFVFAHVNMRVCHVPLQTPFTADSLFTGRSSLHSHFAGRPVTDEIESGTMDMIEVFALNRQAALT